MCGRLLKGFYFDNFHAIVGRNGNGDIRFLNYNSSTSWPMYEKIEIKNSSFWKPGNKWALIQTTVDSKEMIQNFVMRNLYFVKPIANPTATFSGIMDLTLKKLYIGGQRIRPSYP